MNERLERGVSYALQGWAPVSDSVIRDVRLRASQGEYRNDTSLAMKDVRRDPTLALLVLKRLSETAAVRGDLQSNLSEIFSKNGERTLSDILESTPEICSNHRLTDATPEQLACITRSAIAASASESIGEHTGISPHAAFVTSSLRQMGHILIAWNYPHLYQRVLKERSPDANVDQSLTALLGFSPTLLAVTIAQRWHFTPSTCAALGDEQAIELLSAEEQMKSEALRQICEAGEALARSMYPEHFPDAERDWQDASAFIRAKLGPSGMRAVLSSVRTYLTEFQGHTPQVTTLPSRLTVQRDDTEAPVLKTKTNKHIRACPPALAAIIEDIYEQMPHNGVSRDALDALLKQAIPLAGFDRGGLYLLDPDSMLLRPRVPIGTIELTDLASHAFSGRSRSAISAALHSLLPYEGHSSEIDGTTRSIIAGALGVEHKSGVLYLEVGEQLSMRPAEERLSIFKALRQALNDILRLE